MYQKRTRLVRIEFDPGSILREIMGGQADKIEDKRAASAAVRVQGRHRDRWAAFLGVKTED